MLYIFHAGTFEAYGVLRESNVEPSDYVFCLGDENTVSECGSTCNTVKFECCQTNATLEIRCTETECLSIIAVAALGAVAFLLLILLVVSCSTAIVLGIKLKRAKRKQHYESEPHNYVEQQIGQ